MATALGKLGVWLAAWSDRPAVTHGEGGWHPMMLYWFRRLSWGSPDGLRWVDEQVPAGRRG